MTDHDPNLTCGTCPKCGGTDVRVQRRAFGHRNYLPAGWFSQLRVGNYACATCGYLESFIDPADLKKLARAWPRLTGSADEPATHEVGSGT